MYLNTGHFFVDVLCPDILQFTLHPPSPSLPLSFKSNTVDEKIEHASPYFSTLASEFST